MHRLFKVLVHGAVPLAAFLTFMLQPIAGKLLMPVYGGSAGTWLTLSLFFQGALLAGYAFSWWGMEKCPRHFGGYVVAAAILAPLALRLPLLTFGHLAQWPGVLLALTVSLLPTVVFTTSIGLILQGWIVAEGEPTPFYLYAFSNIGSTCALLAYPFFIEPHIGLHLQITVFKALLVALAVITVVLWRLHHLRPAAGPSSSAKLPSNDELPAGASVAWFLLSLATCTLMLGAIPVLSAEYGSNPLTWVLPLGIYLLSYSVIFSGAWNPALNYLAMVALSAGLVGYMLTMGVGPNHLSNAGRGWLACVLIAGCLGGQGFLYHIRPAKNASFFYVVLALGGLAAGLLVSAGGPVLFSRNVEFTGAAFFLLVFLALQLLGRQDALARYSLALLVILPAAGLLLHQLLQERASSTRTAYSRNTYGTLVVSRYTQWLTLSNESTLHGEQLIDKKGRRIPTTYYTRGSAAGIVLNALEAKSPSLRIGAVGLGAGTLAAYGRTGDKMLFWDINPLAIRIAQEVFSYVRDCPAQVEIRRRDGRLGVAESNERFDAIVIDAFSGDSIPAHLVTREAIDTYLAHLDHGILLVHISNRYLDLFPVVAGSARRPGWKCLYVNSNPRDVAKIALLANPTSYAVVYPEDREAEVLGWFDAFRSNTDFEILTDSAPDAPVVNWTDDRSAILDVLPWDKVLFR